MIKKSEISGMCIMSTSENQDWEMKISSICAVTEWKTLMLAILLSGGSHIELHLHTRMEKSTVDQRTGTL